MTLIDFLRGWFGGLQQEQIKRGPPSAEVFQTQPARVSTKLIDFVKQWEGFIPCPQWDRIASPPVVNWGYGHVRKGDEAVPVYVSEATATSILYQDLREIELAVFELVRVPIKQYEFDALVSFAFNVGPDLDEDEIPEGLGDSSLLKCLNRGDRAGALREWPLWCHAGGKVVPGLVRRRAAEAAMFLRGEYRGP